MYIYIKHAHMYIYIKHAHIHTSTQKVKNEESFAQNVWFTNYVISGIQAVFNRSSSHTFVELQYNTYAL